MLGGVRVFSGENMLKQVPLRARCDGCSISRAGPDEPGHRLEDALDIAFRLAPEGMASTGYFHGPRDSPQVVAESLKSHCGCHRRTGTQSLCLHQSAGLPLRPETDRLHRAVGKGQGHLRRFRFPRAPHLRCHFGTRATSRQRLGWAKGRHHLARKVAYVTEPSDDKKNELLSMPENTDHPTQKPEKLLAKIILASSNEGDMIFDPFLGSGTTAVTASKLGRNFCGLEIDEYFCLLAQKRLNLAMKEKSIQGFSDGLFWERNTLSEQKKNKNNNSEKT